MTCTTARLTVSIRVAKSRSRTRSSVSSPQRRPLSTAVSTSSLDCASGRHSYTAANCSGVMIVRGWAGTGGVLTPLHGCRNVTWSLSAVVKTALSTTKQ